MRRKALALVLTLVSYFLIYSGLRFLIARFFGKDTPYARLAASFGTLALSPRFKYEASNGEKRLDARWLLFRKQRKVHEFGEADAVVEGGEGPSDESGEKEREESATSSGEGPTPEGADRDRPLGADA